MLSVQEAMLDYCSWCKIAAACVDGWHSAAAKICLYEE